MVIKTYEEARSLIKNGDLISFCPNDRNWLHRLTLKVTQSDYYHSGMAVWLEAEFGTRRLFVCEAHKSGRRLVPLSLYENNSFDVLACPVEFHKIEAPALDRVGKVKYGFMDFIAVGLRILFGIHLKDQSGEICSEFIQDEYNKAGFSMPQEVLSPGELHGYLLSLGIEHRVSVRKGQGA